MFTRQVKAKYTILASKYKMSKTYETWSHEDTDIGETDKKGFEYQDQAFDSLWEMAKEIRNSGATEPSDHPTVNIHTWYSTPDGDEDYKTGERTYYSFHPKGITPDEAKELYKYIRMPHDEFKKYDPDLI